MEERNYERKAEREEASDRGKGKMRVAQVIIIA